jgi:2-polyprenyl-6-methoxyphenol hydroxylase-like FAD-dependent oxidoreductase
MGTIVVCGGGVIGLSAAMMLAQDGHQVTVLETDSEGVPMTPGVAWESWRRKGVSQFRQPHNLFARFRQVCDEELPGLTERLLAAGCVWVDPLESVPPGISDLAPRPGDEALRFVTGRRPVAECVTAAAAEEQPGVVIRRGVRVTELTGGLTAIPGIPHVSGVRTSTGEKLRADLVVDAMGRRSPSAKMLAALGARAPYEQAEDSGFTYYTRYFTGPSRPAARGPWLMPLGTISLLTLAGDNDTWSVTVFTSSGDAPVKALRDAECFTRVVRACPLQAHWLDGRPITAVMPMAGVLDRYRRFVVDGAPIVTGLAAVGDAWACTNPSAGRGVSVGMVHAQLLRRTVRTHLDDPAGFAQTWDEGTEQLVGPFYQNQIKADRARLTAMTALREGREWSPPDSAMARLTAAASCDADVFRALMETVLCLALPEEVIERPGIRAQIKQSGRHSPPPAPGPDRAQLLHLLTT